MNCSILDRKSRKNINQIKDWSSIPKIFDKAPKQIFDIKITTTGDKCGNYYVFFNSPEIHSHLSFHYLKKDKKGNCKCWTKNKISKNSKTRKNNRGSNIHYKDDSNKDDPIYTPIFVKNGKFTYSKSRLNPKHGVLMKWILTKLNRQ
jgi:hypothetical protein